VELPCTQCAKKGLRCGKADKVWGRKRQRQENTAALQFRTEPPLGEIEHSRVDLVGFIIPPPDDERISSFEEMCVSFYFQHVAKRASRMRSCILRRSGINVKSNAVRQAIVLNSIRVLRERGRVVVTETQQLEYLGQVYWHAQVAIQQNKFLDLLYACHHLCEYLRWSASPIEEIAKHSLGFFLSLQHLQQTVTLDLSEREMVFYMYFQMAYLLLMTYHRHDKNAANARIILEALKPAT
jgi:hypothetical protein